MKSVPNIKRLSKREVIFLMGGMTALAFLMLIFRIKLEGNFRYTFLIWNLFLAYLPLGFTLIYQKLSRSRMSRALVLSSWLLFFPNAPYIITDYIHLRHYFTFLDFSIVTTYAFLGLLAGFYSLHILQGDSKLLNRRWSLPILFFLTSIGVYLGRFIRWNSWDIIDHPFQIIGDVLGLFIYPIYNIFALVFILLFTVILILAYETFKMLLSVYHEKEIQH